MNKLSKKYYFACLAICLIWPFTSSAQSLPLVSGATYDGAQISWDPIDGATGYNVHYFDEAAGWLYLTTVGNVTSYVPDAAGDYIIVGYDNIGNFSPFQIDGGVNDTNDVFVNFADTPAGQLPIVTGASYDGSSIMWDALNGATGYNVHYFYEGTGWSYLETVGNVTSYVPDMAGSYIIVGYDNAGNYSPFQIDGGDNDTNDVSISFTGTPAEQLGIVTGLAFDGSSMTWDALDGATGYNVHYFYAGTGWSYLATVGNVTSYVPEMTGNYIIVGYDDAGNYGPFQINGGGNSNAIDIR